MTNTILAGLAAGALTVLICTSKAGSVVRKQVGKLHRHLDYLVNCCFCTSWWVSIAMLQEFSIREWAATVAIANFTVCGIHMAMSTVEEE